MTRLMQPTSSMDMLKAVPDTADSIDTVHSPETAFSTVKNNVTSRNFMGNARNSMYSNLDYRSIPLEADLDKIINLRRSPMRPP